MRLATGTNYTADIQIALVGETGANRYLLQLIEEATGTCEATWSAQLQLSACEAQVLHCISQGKANRYIADILGLNPRAANKHLEKIFK